MSTQPTQRFEHGTVTSNRRNLYGRDSAMEWFDNRSSGRALPVLREVACIQFFRSSRNPVWMKEESELSGSDRINLIQRQN